MTVSDAEGARLATESLQFFALDAADQIRSCDTACSKFAVPTLFPDVESGDKAPDYFMGVACVFKTYRASFFSREWNENQLDELDDFNHRLNDLMHYRLAADWSRDAVIGEGAWMKLRKNARLALQKMGLSLKEMVPIFDVSALINIDEFVTSEEVRKILDL